MTTDKVYVVLGSDHAGRRLRLALADHLRQTGHEVVDLGPSDEGSVDYPDCALPVCQRVAQRPGALGILVCGTGIGMSLAANAHRGIRAALCTSELMGRLARAHNDANVLCLGERILGQDAALAVADAFVTTPFAAGRHARRLAKLSALREGL